MKLGDNDRVRYFYARYLKRNPRPRLSLRQFAEYQSTVKLGVSLYGHPELYQRWLHVRGG